MNFENLLIPMEPAEEAVSSDKSLDKIIGRLKLLSVNYQSLQLRMNGTDSAIKNQLIVYNTQLVQILNDLQKLPKNATESFGDIAEEPATEGTVGKVILGTILAAIAISDIRNKVKAKKSKNELKQRLAKKTPEENQSWNTLITKWNPVLRTTLTKMNSEIKSELTKAGLYKESFTKFPAVEFPREQKQIDGAVVFGYGGSFMSTGFTSFVISLEEMTGEEWDNWDVDKACEIVDGVVYKYKSIFDKWSDVLKLNISYPGDYLSIDVDLRSKLTDEYGVLKPGLRNP